MGTMEHAAKHFQDVHFGGNWTCSNLKDNLEGISWQQAITKFESLNTIAALVFHINYYVDAVLKVSKGGALEAHDKFSYDHAPINSEQDWVQLKSKTLKDAQELSELIAKMPEDKLWENISENEKHGNYFRNIHGIIEHTHYHLGQIAILKKLICVN